MDFVGHAIHLEAIKTIKSKKLIESNTTHWGEVNQNIGETCTKLMQNSQLIVWKRAKKSLNFFLLKFSSKYFSGIVIYSTMNTFP